MFAITRQPAFRKYTSNIRHDCTSRVGGTMSRDDDLRIRLGRVRDRGRVRRVKPFIAQALAAAEKAGGFKRRSGHGARTSTFGRGRAASFAAATRRTERARGAMVKARVVRHGIKRAPLSAHLEYLRRDGVTKDDTPGRMFDAEQDSADHRAFAGRCTDDRHHFRFIVSPDDAEQLSDLKAFTRDLMRQAERDLGTRLDWVAVDHWNTEHPHIHVIVRGVADDGRDLVISRDYISHGLRARASELVTLELGPRSDLDIHRRLDAEIEADRWTKLDRVLATEAAQHDRIVDLRPERDQASDGDTRSALVGRMRKLERLGLAKELGPARWYLSERAEPILRALGERNDIIKRIHQGLAEQQIERSVSNYVLEQEDPARPIIGRLVARGLDDELRETAYAVIDGIDGRPHHVRLQDLNATSDGTPGSIVELRQFKDSMGRERTAIAVRSDLPLAAQVEATGATWLDRQLIAREPASLSSGGFGLEVQHAMNQRADHLIRENLARREGQRLVFARNLLDSLRRRELDQAAAQLASDSGLPYRPAAEGDVVSGVYRQRLNLASGRFAMIDDGLGFSLVPWTPSLERHLSREVLGIARVSRIEWTFARSRGLGIG
jgi:type IV secretory pathway VirD2 relaxase